MKVLYFIKWCLGIGLVVGLLSIPVLGVQAQAPTIYHVKPSATGDGSGSDWDNATTLQDALGKARPGEEVWVTAGVYVPGDTVSDTFKIPAGVKVYGHFAGIESTISARIFSNPAYCSILSGDLAGDDINTDGVVITATDIITPNVYHVVTLDGTRGTVIIENTVLDGFTITGGDAQGDPSDVLGDTRNHGGGIMCFGAGSGNACSPTFQNLMLSGNSAQAGGAMFNDGSDMGRSNPQLRNVTFSGNIARFAGALMNHGYDHGESSPTLTDVTFINNSAPMSGGAMYNNAHTQGESNPVLLNVKFIENATGYSGGGVYNAGWYGGVVNPQLTNVLFYSNTAAIHGGAMSSNGKGSPTLANVTFAGNTASIGEAGVLYNNNVITMHLNNVIIWGNTAITGSAIYNELTSTVTISYSLIEGGWDGINVVSEASSRVTDGGGNIDADPLFVDAANGDLHLQATSPAIDAGDNAALPSGITTDLDGNPRFADIPTVADTGNGTPPIVDMGAYERQIVRNAIYLPLVLRQ